MKILMGVPAKERTGGPTTHLPYLVDYFRNNSKYSIKTFPYGSKTDSQKNIFHKIFNTISTIITFMYYLINYRPDIIHLNTAFDKISVLRDVPFSLVSFITRKKLIFKIHGSHYDLLNSNSKLYLLLAKAFFVGASKIGVLSEREKQEFINKYGSKKIIVVKNIVNNIYKKNDSVDLVEFDKSKTTGLFVSRLVKGKGLDDLIIALPLILKDTPNFRLIVAGDGDSRDDYKKMAISRGVESSIVWLGHVELGNLQSLYKNADIFIFPTHFPEGMPMVLVEALRSGTPIICTSVRFAEDYLTENVNCLYIEKGSPQSIAKQTKKILANDQLKEKMKIDNPKLVDSFNIKNVGKEFENIYEEMLKS